MAQNRKKLQSHRSLQASAAQGPTANSKSGSGPLKKSVYGLASLVISVLLTWIFWWPLWSGGGLIGGDIYPYYFPQKTYFSEALSQSTVPFWNDLVGFGYPVVAESQTGVFYPPNLAFYSILPVTTAFNLSQISHYIITFLGSLFLARRLGVSRTSAIFTATVFTYAWFPSRICLEWCIIGGAWFVWTLWGATAFLQTNHFRYLALTAGFLTLNLLAGHYNIAFISLLSLIPLPWLIHFESTDTSNDIRNPRIDLWKRSGSLVGAALLAFLAAAIQIGPSWELKSLSQRQDPADGFVSTYGSIPVQAFSQLWNPLGWYANETPTDSLLQQCEFLVAPGGTNQVEAQFYMGAIPLLLTLAVLLIPAIRKHSPRIHLWKWGLLIAISMLFATGWPTYWLSWAPGFSFFRGPGRYTIVAAFALAILAGAGLDAIFSLRNWTTLACNVVATFVIAITVVDLWAASRKYDLSGAPYVGRQVFYATLVDHPTSKHLNESILADIARKHGPTFRMFAPGANIPTMLGISSIPTYLGLGPQLYETKEFSFDFTRTDPDSIDDAVSRLRRFGVTHLLLESPIREQLWPVTNAQAVFDRFLNPTLTRREPYYLYEIQNSPGRISLESDDPQNRILNVTFSPNRVRVELECDSPCKLVLRDLSYPGWRLASAHHVPQTHDGHFRAVSFGENGNTTGRQIVEWVFLPTYFGLASACSVMGVAGIIFLFLRDQLSSTMFRRREATRPPE
ncbi:hypothetical protein SH668x_002098 [Planctomicrobium sp. SH668]|uniref:hypothetical protein n=1 Tax=Planctomicrobium sp. SH668 TaxID=3448126 RepID=UPI003F5BA609